VSACLVPGLGCVLCACPGVVLRPVVLCSICLSMCDVAMMLDQRDESEHEHEHIVFGVVLLVFACVFICMCDMFLFCVHM